MFGDHTNQVFSESIILLGEDRVGRHGISTLIKTSPKMNLAPVKSPDLSWFQSFSIQNHKPLGSLKNCSVPPGSISSKSFMARRWSEFGFSFGKTMGFWSSFLMDPSLDPNWVADVVHSSEIYRNILKYIYIEIYEIYWVADVFGGPRFISLSTASPASPSAQSSKMGQGHIQILSHIFHSNLQYA